MIRNIKNDDWDKIEKIQLEVYDSSLIENIDVLKRKVDLYSSSCWVVEKNSDILGYLLAHPWRQGEIAPLNQTELIADEKHDFYIHDLSVSSKAQGLGIGKALVQKAVDFACSHGFDSLALVAVQNACSFWARFGFEKCDASASLTSYGSGAQYMRRSSAL